jgi:hypothetical protein
MIFFISESEKWTLRKLTGGGTPVLSQEAFDEADFDVEPCADGHSNIKEQIYTVAKATLKSEQIKGFGGFDIAAQSRFKKEKFYSGKVLIFGLLCSIKFY